MNGFKGQERLRRRGRVGPGAGSSVRVQHRTRSTAENDTYYAGHT